MYLGVGAEGGVLSFGPFGFRELFSHNSFENHKLLSFVSGESNMNVPVVILAKPPGFSNVGSFTLKSKSRLLYAIAQSPSVDKPQRMLFCSFVSALTIFTILITDTLQPPCAKTLMMCSGAFTDSRKNPWIA